MKSVLRSEVRQRAGGRCEYCQTPDWVSELPHEVDHIRAVKHDGLTELSNLSWACARCNDFKGSDVSAFVPGTDRLVRPFNPRIDVWNDHFSWDGHLLRGITEIAQATIALLRLNAESRVNVRRILMDEGLFFSTESRE